MRRLPRGALAALAGVLGIGLELAALATWFAKGLDRASLPAFWAAHTAASALLAAALALGLARKRTQRRPAGVALVGTLLMAWPVLGWALLPLALGRMRRLQPRPPRQRFGEVRLPPLERIEPRRLARRVAGLGAQVARGSAPLPLQQQVLTLLTQRPSAAGNQTLAALRETGQLEDVRLLAYGVLDRQQQRLQNWIAQARAALPAAADPARLWALLAELHWELAHQGLASDDLREHALQQTLHWLQALQQRQGELAPRLRLLRLRAWLALGRRDAARAEVEAMAREPSPDPAWLPYMAEWAYEANQLDLCRRWLGQLPATLLSDKLQPVVRYWTRA
ncbi:hypothetical protein EDC36_1036 [Tepidimonas ignava]|uniref:Uncharacterized protein n=1 Tax=Tepidimonas ignava TaxID=114249 RepID=A0A4R3LFJ6_9BURK|nr:hypothetical protein [Tepidimonas ignava]TCS98951.1 hypothetical protein EDC36_1036 [Tepidimonas ignava]TSE22966.1 hypothetical protein Tigna_00949 [Tepidimonas ignava]